MLIVIEGIAGAGKTTLINALCDRLLQTARLVNDIEFPSRGRIGHIIRSAGRASSIGQLLTPPLAPESVLHLSLADLYDEMPRWETRLAEGDVILCERYIVALRVYQIDYHSPYMVHNVCRRAESVLPMPDLYIILNTPPEVALERLRMRSAIEQLNPRLPPSAPPPDLDHLQVWAIRYLQVASALGPWLPNGERGVLLIDGKSSPQDQCVAVLARMAELERAENAT